MRLTYVGLLCVVCGIVGRTALASQATTETQEISTEERLARKRLEDAFVLLTGTKQEQKDAVAMLEQETGDRFIGDAALNDLGWYYGNIKGDWEKAVPYYEKAAKHGKLEALLNIADCYKRGLGVKKDAERAAFYREEAEAVYAKLQKQSGKPNNKSLHLLIKENHRKFGKISKEQNENMCVAGEKSELEAPFEIELTNFADRKKPAE